MAKLKVDFTGVSESGGLDVGNHLVKVVSIEKKEGDEYPFLKWDLEVTKGACKGRHIDHYTSLKPSALFNLRNTLVSLGLNVPKSALSFDTDALKGKTMGIEVFLKKGDDGKEYSNIKKTFLAGSAKKEKAKVVEDEEEEFDADLEDEFEVDADEDDDELEL